MNMHDCERCGPRHMGKDGKVHGERADYCAVCSKNLCAECMAKGCCGNVPAQSGNEGDEEDTACLPSIVRTFLAGVGVAVPYSAAYGWSLPQRKAALDWAIERKNGRAGEDAMPEHVRQAMSK